MDTLKSPGQNVFVYDLEIYPNYFLALFKPLNKDKWQSFIIGESVSTEKTPETTAPAEQSSVENTPESAPEAAPEKNFFHKIINFLKKIILKK